MIEIPVRVRDALKSGAYRNNYRVVVLDQDGNEDFTIDNDNLVEESVTVDERMCSTDTLKFGLCEGTNIEFQYFDYPNITGRKVKLYIDVTYRDESHTLKEYEIPLGWFDIKECSRQAETGIIKASGYNKLLSDYLDQDLTEAVKNIVTNGESGVSGSASIQHILDSLLYGYSIKTEEKADAKTRKSPIDTLGYASYSIPHTVADNRCIHIGLTRIRYSIEDISESDYYAFELFAKQLRDKIKTWCPYLSETIDSISNQPGTPITIEQLIDNGFNNDFGSHISISNFNVYAKNGKAIYTDSFEGEDVKYKPFVTNILTSWAAWQTTPIELVIPVLWYKNTNYNYEDLTDAQVNTCKSRGSEILNTLESVKVYKRILSEMEKYKVTSANVSSITNGLTLRALQSATFELSAQYGKLDRVTDLFSGVNLNGGRLYPSETLYPANDLYPRSNSEHIIRANYSQLWADEGNVRKFRNLIVTYKDSTTNQDATITAIVNADGTDDYIMSDNWLLKNLAWTQAQVNNYISGMVEAMRGVTWFPFQMWLAGLPYIEAGDEIEITSGGLVYPSYVLTRTLKGIQDLQDTYTNGTLNIF